MLCYTLPDVSWWGPSSIPITQTPGFVARARALGYRTAPPPPPSRIKPRSIVQPFCLHQSYTITQYAGTVAGPSGTTANVLQLASLFGFSPSELAVLRLTMCAWMIVTDDHSFFEIMLAAQPHMPLQLHMSMGLEDLGQLWPLSFAANTSGGVFSSIDVWSAVAAAMRTPEGARLLAAMSSDAQQYFATLLPPPPPPPASLVPSPPTVAIAVGCVCCVLLLVAVAAIIWRRRARARDRGLRIGLVVAAS